MALDQITFKGVTEIRERSSTTIRAGFRDSQNFVNVAPLNISYRLDDDSSGLVLVDWTSKAIPVLPINYVDIALTADQCRIVNPALSFERKTITVMADRGLATQFVGSYTFAVRNLAWSS